MLERDQQLLYLERTRAEKVEVNGTPMAMAQGKRGASREVELAHRRDGFQTVQNGELRWGEDLGMHSSGAIWRKAAQSGTVRRETRSAPPSRKKLRMRSRP